MNVADNTSDFQKDRWSVWIFVRRNWESHLLQSQASSVRKTNNDQINFRASRSSCERIKMIIEQLKDSKFKLLSRDV